MSIDFDDKRWERIRKDAALWWTGELERPLIRIVVDGNDPGRSEPALPKYPFDAFYDLSVPASAIVDRWDYDLSCKKYLGDAFPFVQPTLGTGIVAAYLGAISEKGKDTVWLHPEKEMELAYLHFEYDPDNIWLRRTRELYQAAVDRWGGKVLLGMTELGGSLDILSTFRPAEKLLLDLCDNPDEVKRLIWEVHELWWRYYDEFKAIFQATNPGYSDWGEIYSDKPCFMLQCDLCCMISPDMFDEFVKPELTASCRRMPNSFYHLDGPGALAHLDSLLSIEELKGVQWIPGRGVPDARHWPEVFGKIRAAGKLTQIYGGETDVLDIIVEQLGSGKGVFYEAICGEGFAGYTEAEANVLLEKYGIDFC